jgi:hypothetical protein
MCRKLSAASRKKLETELEELRIQYRALRTKAIHSRGKQRKQDEAACHEVGQRIDAILWRLAEANSRDNYD